MKKLIVVTGLPGSGKSEVSGEIRRRRIPTVTTGDIVKEEVRRRGLDLTAESEESIARELREQYGPDAPIRLAEQRIQCMKGSLVCVDGPRNVREVEYLRRFGRVHLIVVKTPQRERYRRLRRRGTPRDPEGWERFLWRDRKELERGLRSLMRTKRFDKHVIRNTGTLVNLRHKVGKILSEIRNDKPARPARRATKGHKA